MNSTYLLFANTEKEMTCKVTVIDDTQVSYEATDGFWCYSGRVDRFPTEVPLAAAIEQHITITHGV